MSEVGENDDPGAWKRRVRLIAINPALRREVEAFLPEMERRAVAIRDDAAAQELLVAKMAEQRALFGVRAASREEWATIFGAYLHLLGELPLECVLQAFDRWGRNELYPKDPGRHAFFPKANELYELARPSWFLLRTAIYRARRAMEWIEDKPLRSAEQIAADRAEVREMMRRDGLLKDDGTIDAGRLMSKTYSAAPVRQATGETRAQMAERIRRQADGGGEAI